MEDRHGNLWFASFGSGVFRYDGNSFRNFTTRDGLINSEISCIYEDQAGNIWFGANGGASCYDGESFRNYMVKGDSMVEDRMGKSFPDFTRPSHEVNSIVEDKTGRFWFATRGNTFVYDRATFAMLAHDGKPFINVRCLMEDSSGNIWLGRNGLWRYDGRTYTKFTHNRVCYAYEDDQGNIWTSSQMSHRDNWVLSYYDANSLSTGMPTVTEICTRPIIWSIFQANDGRIWFGANGVLCYDGKTITHFNNKY